VKNKKVLVTGGLGYIGSHTIVKLYENGYEPIIIDNLSNSNISVLDSIEEIVGTKPLFYELDIERDIAQICQMLLREKVEYVIHFAGYKSVKESVVNPIKYFSNNINSTTQLLYALQISGVKKLIFSSSATVYGEADYFPVTENTPRKKPTNPYGESKYICEDIIETTCKFTGLSAVSLRYFNPIGAHPSGKIFENPKGIPENLVPYIQRVISGEYEKLTIFGNDYDTIDGTCIRDYIDVNDLAQAHINALNVCENGYKFYNIGSGSGYSVLELINEFKKQSIDVPFVFASRRSGDVPKIYADITKAKLEMNWSPSVSIEETIKSIINLK
jgi:UDP-glucose 4-epimerase